jgi:hypothetical protein
VSLPRDCCTTFQLVDTTDLRELELLDRPLDEHATFPCVGRKAFPSDERARNPLALPFARSRLDDVRVATLAVRSRRELCA